MIETVPDLPAAARAFTLGRVAGLDALRAAETEVDWVVLAPPPIVLDGGGPYSYADLATALVDEIEAPRHRWALVDPVRS